MLHSSLIKVSQNCVVRVGEATRKVREFRVRRRAIWPARLKAKLGLKSTLVRPLCHVEFQHFEVELVAQER